MARQVRKVGIDEPEYLQNSVRTKPSADVALHLCWTISLNPPLPQPPRERIARRLASSVPMYGLASRTRQRCWANLFGARQVQKQDLLGDHHTTLLLPKSETAATLHSHLPKPISKTRTRSFLADSHRQPDAERGASLRSLR